MINFLNHSASETKLKETGGQCLDLNLQFGPSLKLFSAQQFFRYYWSVRLPWVIQSGWPSPMARRIDLDKNDEVGR